MNPQLKQLAQQAGISILYEYDGYDGHAGVADLANIEKFAELIVQQTLNVALYGDEFEQARANVKMLFGVKHD